MAARHFQRLLVQNAKIYRSFSTQSAHGRKIPKLPNVYILVGGGILTCALLKAQSSYIKAASSAKPLKREDDKTVKLTTRERRFIKFASVEFNGQLYMTPQDFLDSVVEQEPRPRLKRRILIEKEINEMRDHTPQMKKGSTHFFRSLRDRGIISYTEYLFLLSILTKPHSGFRIAFNMFDTDGNQRVDKNEFLVLIRIIIGSFTGMDEEALQAMERIFSGAWKDRRGQTDENAADSENIEQKAPVDDYIDDEEGLQRKHVVPTTVQTHFFGTKGDKVLQYEGFHKFMDNLQTEVLELEFNEFSKGHAAITEVDFAKILLRYTYLDTDEYDSFLERLLDRIKEQRGITFVEFRDFCRFLNNLDDFAIAMRMYTLADHAISKDEFSRAVKICTGYTLTKHLIDTVFAIFDEDGDGRLSYKEFIGCMKDRLHRGFKVSAGHTLEYNEQLDMYEEVPQALFAVWRQRACRHLDHFRDEDAHNFV